jgi:glycerol-3-phosphate dehydrogenase
MGNIIRLSRRPENLCDEVFDVLVVGAGIFGACAAWEAALRGYRVAIVDQDDFCSGVSANSYKIVHGGIRYIQHLDVVRVRSSCRERSALLRIAPHLVTPLPIVIPTYGYGMSGKPVLSAGMYLYDLLTADRNRGIDDPSRQVPLTRLLGKQDTLDLFPGINPKGLTGATEFSDAQMYNPPRLVLAFLQSAAQHGAVICNHARVDRYLVEGDRIRAVKVTDKLTGDTFEIKARTILNSAGPWTDQMLEEQPELRAKSPGIYSRDACFVVPRRFGHDRSLAVLGATHDPDAFMSRPARHLFVVPWRDYSLIGTWHKVVEARPDRIGIEPDEVQAFIDEIHEGYPDLSLSLDEVSMCNWGLVPFGEDQKGGENLSYGKRSVLLDHQRDGGPVNLVSLIGIRYTMGRGDARMALKLIARMLGDDRKPQDTTRIPIYGGDFDNFDQLVRDVGESLADGDDRIARSMAHNHGSNATGLLSTAEPGERKPIGSSHVTAAEVRHAIEHEMAQTLEDVALRRTDLATGGLPDEATLAEFVDLAGRLLGLDENSKAAQLASLRRRVPGWDWVS